MKRLLTISVIVAMVGSVSLAAARTWTSSNGRFTTETELLDFRDGTAQLKKTDGPMHLELTRTVDILGALRGRAGRRLVVGFAAETEAVEENAARKLESKGLDLIVANDVTAANAGFEVPSVGAGSFRYRPTGGSWAFAGGAGISVRPRRWTPARV